MRPSNPPPAVLSFTPSVPARTLYGGAPVAASQQPQGTFAGLSSSSSRPLSSTTITQQQHPILEALQKSLAYVDSHNKASQNRIGSQTARPAGPPKRQTSATMRRKFAALEAIHSPSAGVHLARLNDSAAASTSSHSALPPSILPASAREYTRPPATNFIASLHQHTGMQNPQWETLVFPSANPAVEDGKGGGGESEMKRLAGWFDAAWTELELKAQAEALKEKRSQVITQAQALQLQEKRAPPLEEKSGGGPSSSSVVTTTTLSPAALHALDLQREKLCFMVFTELLRHVTAASRRRGALLEKVWMAHHRLTERRISHRISEIISLSEANSHAALARMTQRFEDLLRNEKAQLMKSGVDMTYLQAELEAKERIIANLHEENDKDLLYSNQIVCHKEMAFLKLERESKATAAENLKLSEDLKFLSEDKLTLEDQLARLEEDKEDLVSQVATVQEIVDAKLRGKTSVETQYAVEDIPPEPSEEEKRRRESAWKIQKVFRGFRTRRKLKLQGLLSRKLLLKKLHGLHSATSGNTVGLSGLITGGLNLLLPLIPKGFSHLMSTLDMEMNRDHFIRLFARKNLLKWIHKLYQEKIVQDQRISFPSPSPPSRPTDLHQPNCLPWSNRVVMADGATMNVEHLELGDLLRSYEGRVVQVVKPFRKDFAEFVYDYYLLRHGSRDAAEMDLLDLFASMEKNVDVSPRVRLFALFLNHAMRHRKVLTGASKPGSDGGSVAQAPILTKRHHVAERTHIHLLEHGAEKKRDGRLNGTGLLNGGANSPPPQVGYTMSESERHAHELKLRLTLTLNGGRHLSARTLDFYLAFLTISKKYGQGPFQTVGDNNDGIMWIDSTSMVDLTQKALNRFPIYLVRATIAKLHQKASMSRTTVLSMTGLNTSVAATSVTDALQNALPSGAIPGVSDLPSSAVDANQRRFVDFDLMMEVLVETYIDEDARMHHLLYDLFLNPNPAAGVAQQRDRATAAEVRKSKVLASEDGSRPSHLTLDTSDASDDAHPSPSGSSQSGSLEPEMFSFVHFSDVVKAMGATWDEDKMLKVYQQSVQRAVHRQVSIEDFVLTVRAYGLMPVEVDFDLIEQSHRPMQAAADGGENDQLPSVDDDGLGHAEEDALERRHQELKDKMRELEASYNTKLEYANRRYERELSAMKQSHEKELVLTHQASQQASEASKRQLDSERSKAASDYNLLFESTTVELVQLKHAMEQRDKKEAETIAALQAGFKAKLHEADHTILLLQGKLTSRAEKYERKKAHAVTLQARVGELESILTKSGGLASPSSQYLSPDTKALIDGYKKADEENRQINADLLGELNSVKTKYKELMKNSKELLKAQHGVQSVSGGGGSASARRKTMRRDSSSDASTSKDEPSSSPPSGGKPSSSRRSTARGLHPRDSSSGARNHSRSASLVEGDLKVTPTKSPSNEAPNF